MKLSPALTKATQILATLSDPVRLRILHLLWRSGEVCVCHLHLSLELPQPTVSRHLSRLRRDRLVAIRKDGHWIHYRADLLQEPLAGAIFTSLAMGLAHETTLADDISRLACLKSSQCLIPTDEVFA
ncbi:MAG: metalloregulator ArsR/SmtB family transcription factor [Planctomycetota bacterium]|jgi:ArsR family transcriptional regulator, arsenate/arsenite/antimonite-responsive transcriptional repressor|nr:metalloregulator ArsR/SmtB family transcription factor [Planctomycetota bacterium]RLT10297.1 MAG: transcriptional regulator [Planctomycetota bacterium]